MEESFPRFQFSVFTKDQGQFVVRSNSLEQFTEDLKTVLAMRKASDAVSSPITPQNDVAAAYYNPNVISTSHPVCPICPKCKGEQVYNPKTGKVFCVRKCWLNAGQLSSNQ